MTIGYADAGDLLAAFVRAYETFDGELAVSLFSDDAESHEGPFSAPMIGHNAIRARWLELAASRDQVELTIERHLVSGDTVVAIWHLGYVGRLGGEHRRVAGIFVLEVRDGRLGRLRAWSQERRADTVGGDPAAG